MIGNNSKSQISKLKSQNLGVGGFTIMEMVVVMGIFSIASLYSLNVFVRSNQVQKRIANTSRLETDGRYTLETIAREFRLGAVDYGFYGSNGYNPAFYSRGPLALRDVNNQPIRFRLWKRADNSIAVLVSYGKENPALSDYQDITPSGLTVNKMYFYVTPKFDPNGLDASNNFKSNLQPQMTMIMETQTINTAVGETKISNFQTTVTSRSYKR